jgi:hypothetical protein
MFLNFCSQYVIRSFRHFYSDKSSPKVSILGSKYNIFSKDNFYFIIGAFIPIRINTTKRQRCAFRKKVWQRVSDVKFTSLVPLLVYMDHFLYLLIKIIKCITIPQYQLEFRGISILIPMFAGNEK